VTASPPIRVLIAVLGLDQHEAGSLAVARILRDAGIEVIYAGRFQLPETIAQTAVEEDVKVVGISCHSWEFLHYARELAEVLHAADPPIPVVVGGSVVTRKDREDVLASGVDEAVLPTSTEDDVVATFVRLANRIVVKGESG
jgi:methylmalonyl-CoA mutase C-terminal domain/subunit